jgi:hypothetical protein
MHKIQRGYRVKSDKYKNMLSKELLLIKNRPIASGLDAAPSIICAFIKRK